MYILKECIEKWTATSAVIKIIQFSVLPDKNLEEEKILSPFQMYKKQVQWRVIQQLTILMSERKVVLKLSSEFEKSCFLLVCRTENPSIVK
jgi:hypothetical protein